MKHAAELTDLMKAAMLGILPSRSIGMPGSEIGRSNMFLVRLAERLKQEQCELTVSYS